jgi:tetratricopeptide (TPR) repeat protein/predicted Ser/Thr protein kinase
MDALPSAIGRFEIVDRIGQGGMGSLLLAWDPLLERQIAIKILKEAGNEELRARFTREARAVARLRHPHIVTIFDVGEHQGQPFIAMEYIQGHTLGELVRRPDPLPVLRVLEWIGDVCDGLGYAHRAGIVHRDIKPANLMVDVEGSVKILDFGIARVAESGMTQKGLLIGTLNYMSPEQLTGAPLDGRSDMFALGAVLYELLCRRQAFPGGLDSGVLARILHNPPQPVVTLCPGIDPQVVRIVDTALQKDPGDRYADLAAMRREIQRVHRDLSARTEHQLSASGDETMVLVDPGTPARTPRRGTAAQEFAKKRDAQIEQHLNDASSALAASEYELAIAAAERALIMDPNLGRAAQMLDDARHGLDKRQAERWLEEGHEELRRGALTAAAGLLNQALTILPASDAALSLKRAIDEAQAKRREEQARAAALQEALGRAQGHFDAAQYSDVLATCDEALEIEPGHVRASRLKEAAELALEERARQAAERDANDVVQRAQRLAGAGRVDEALALLQHAARHPAVQSAQKELSAVAQRLAHERAEEARALAAVAAARRRADAGEPEAALADLRAFEPPNGSVTSAIAEIERTLELQLQAQLEGAIAAARAALERGDHGAVLDRLRPLAVPSNHRSTSAAVQASLATIGTLVTQAEAAITAQEKERRRLAQLEAHLSDAESLLHKGQLEEAAFRVQAALALDPVNARGLELRGKVDTAVGEQQAAAEYIRAGLARAESAPHADAIAILKEVLARDPASAAANRLLQEREAALERERLEKQRLEEIETARHRAEGHIAAGEWDLADAVIADIEWRLNAKKAMKTTRALLKERRRAAMKSTARADAEAAAAPALRPLVDSGTVTAPARPAWRIPAAAAALILVVAAAGYFLLGGDPPRPAAVQGTAIIDAVPWAAVESVRAGDGTPVTLPQDAATPLALQLPPGTYQVTLVGPPPANTRKEVSLTVTADTPAVLAPPVFTTIQAEEYLLRAIGAK